MGQHKTNPTAIQARNGEIPPKKKGLSKRERERLAMEKLRSISGVDKILNPLIHYRWF